MFFHEIYIFIYTVFFIPIPTFTLYTYICVYSETRITELLTASLYLSFPALQIKGSSSPLSLTFTYILYLSDSPQHTLICIPYLSNCLPLPSYICLTALPYSHKSFKLPSHSSHLYLSNCPKPIHICMTGVPSQLYCKGDLQNQNPFPLILYSISD